MVYIPPGHCSTHCWHMINDPNCKGFPRKQIEKCCHCPAKKSYDSEYPLPRPRRYDPWSPYPRKPYDDLPSWPYDDPPWYDRKRQRPWLRLTPLSSIKRACN